MNFVPWLAQAPEATFESEGFDYYNQLSLVDQADWLIAGSTPGGDPLYIAQEPRAEQPWNEEPEPYVFDREVATFYGDTDQLEWFIITSATPLGIESYVQEPQPPQPWNEEPEPFDRDREVFTTYGDADQLEWLLAGSTTGADPIYLSQPLQDPRDVWFEDIEDRGDFQPVYADADQLEWFVAGPTPGADPIYLSQPDAYFQQPWIEAEPENLEHEVHTWFGDADQADWFIAGSTAGADPLYLAQYQLLDPRDVWFEDIEDRGDPQPVYGDADQVEWFLAGSITADDPLYSSQPLAAAPDPWFEDEAQVFEREVHQNFGDADQVEWFLAGSTTGADPIDLAQSVLSSGQDPWFDDPEPRVFEQEEHRFFGDADQVEWLLAGSTLGEDPLFLAQSVGAESAEPWIDAEPQVYDQEVHTWFGDADQLEWNVAGTVPGEDPLNLSQMPAYGGEWWDEPEQTFPELFTAYGEPEQTEWQIAGSITADDPLYLSQLDTSMAQEPWIDQEPQVFDQEVHTWFGDADQADWLFAPALGNDPAFLAAAHVFGDLVFRDPEPESFEQEAHSFYGDADQLEFLLSDTTPGSDAIYLAQDPVYGGEWIDAEREQDRSDDDYQQFTDQLEAQFATPAAPGVGVEVLLQDLWELPDQSVEDPFSEQALYVGFAEALTPTTPGDDPIYLAQPLQDPRDVWFPEEVTEPEIHTFYGDADQAEWLLAGSTPGEDPLFVSQPHYGEPWFRDPEPEVFEAEAHTTYGDADQLEWMVSDTTPAGDPLYLAQTYQDPDTELQFPDEEPVSGPDQPWVDTVEAIVGFLPPTDEVAQAAQPHFGDIEIPELFTEDYQADSTLDLVPLTQAPDDSYVAALDIADQSDYPPEDYAEFAWLTETDRAFLFGTPIPAMGIYQLEAEWPLELHADQVELYDPGPLFAPAFAGIDAIRIGPSRVDWRIGPSRVDWKVGASTTKD